MWSLWGPIISFDDIALVVSGIYCVLVLCCILEILNIYIYRIIQRRGGEDVLVANINLR